MELHHLRGTGVILLDERRGMESMTPAAVRWLEELAEQTPFRESSPDQLRRCWKRRPVSPAARMLRSNSVVPPASAMPRTSLK